MTPTTPYPPVPGLSPSDKQKPDRGRLDRAAAGPPRTRPPAPTLDYAHMHHFFYTGSSVHQLAGLSSLWEDFPGDLV